MKKYVAELIGTFALVLIGCGSAVVAGDKIGFTGISFAFGLGLITMAYGIGPISGCHINPAVSVGAWLAGRLDAKDLPGYIVAQCVGAILGAAVLYAIASGKVAGDPVTGLGQNGWGPGYIAEYGAGAAFLFEFVATFLFLVVILGSTQAGVADELAGLAIGLALVGIHLFGIPITGVSVNPARSLGPALLVGGQAIEQVWLFLLAPTLGAAAAGLLFRFKVIEKT